MKQHLASFAQKVVNFRFNISFYLLILLALYVATFIFNYMIGYKLPFRFWNNLSPHAFALAWSAVITLPYFFIRKRKSYYFIILALYLFYLLANVWYYRTYYTSIPLITIKQLNNLNGFLPSIAASVRLKDLLLVLPFVTIVFLYYTYFRKYLISVDFSSNLIGLNMCLAVVVTFFGYQINTLVKDSHNIHKKLEVFTIDQCQAARDYGILSVLVWQLSNIVEPEKPITPAEKAQVEHWLARKQRHSFALYHKPTPPAQNVIIIIFESLESWVLEATVNNTEITPNLNRLINANGTIYAPNVVPQTRDGRSSDAQFIINTGLLPLHSGAVFFRYPRNNYHTLAKALKTRAGVTAITMMGDEPSFWNQGEMTPSLGYDKLYSRLHFDMDDEIGLGLSDASFFKQAAAHLKRVRQPYMAQLITLSSHLPFIIPEDKIGIKVPHALPRKLARYIEAINYTDRAIGAFVDELERSNMLETTMLVIVGDHEAFGAEQRKELNSKLPNYLNFTQTPFLPLIITNQPQQLRYNAVMGQIDIYPTLLSALNLNSYTWQGIGTSILSEERTPFAITPGMEIIGDTGAVTAAEVWQSREAWRISEIIIRKKYFDVVPNKF